MVKKRYIKTYSALLPIEKYLEQYESKSVTDWDRILEDLIYKAFNIKNEADYNAFLKYFGLKYFDYERMMDFYERIKVELGFFDDDILKYISFIAALDYFEKIGNPSWEVWLNARNLNKPFEKHGEYEGLSIVEVMGLKYGVNAIKNSLLSAMRVVT
jgi:hypothetical protein